MEKSENLKKRTKDGLLGMTIVGAMSSDPRLVNESLNIFNRKFTVFNIYIIVHTRILELI